MLDPNYLYSSPMTHPSQLKYRMRMTKAVYDEKRQQLWQATVWLAVAIAQVLFMVMALAFIHDLTHELAQSPGAIIGLTIWLIGDIVYICYYPTLHGGIQHELDCLEGKVSS